MVITYLKETGEIKAPIVTSDISLTLEDVMGEEEGAIYSKIYDVINIKDDLDILYNIREYYVDIETKQLRYKKRSKIKYL